MADTKAGKLPTLICLRLESDRHFLLRAGKLPTHNFTDKIAFHK